MALTIVVEDGTGLANANSYISQADADLFFEGHLYATDWIDAGQVKKDTALVHATRVLDEQWLWFGYKRVSTQALGWPRINVRDTDSPLNSGTTYPSWAPSPIYLPEDEVPNAIIKATALTALMLLQQDRVTGSIEQGVKSFELDGVMKVEFDPAYKSDVLPGQILVELKKYGQLHSAKDRVVKLIRA